jgi:insertion element IS1 protein InsB
MEIPENALLQGKGGTVALERNNCRQRHWFARFKRKSLVVSKSLRMVDLTMALFARFHVNGQREEIQSFFC